MLRVDRTEGAAAAPISGVFVNGQFFAIVQLLASRDFSRSETELLTRKPTLLSRYIFLRHLAVLRVARKHLQVRLCVHETGWTTRRRVVKNSCILIVAY